MSDKISVAAYWKVYGRNGGIIDAIENTLHKITGANVTRTETAVGTETFDAVYCVKGELDADKFVDACHFMIEVNAFPH